MIVLLLLLSVPLLVTSSFDDELIIERRPHHVDWEDLFMEYNRYSAPNRLRQEVNLTLDVIAVGEAQIVFELNQHWRDERLRFVGVSRVPVPSHIQPWYPDTYIRNAVNVVVEQKSLDLNYDGTFLLRQKYQAGLTKEIVIASFNNYGTEKIHYNLVDSRMGSSGHVITSVEESVRNFDGLHFDDVVISLKRRSTTESPLETLMSNSTL